MMVPEVFFVKDLRCAICNKEPRYEGRSYCKICFEEVKQKKIAAGRVKRALVKAERIANRNAILAFMSKSGKEVNKEIVG